LKIIIKVETQYKALINTKGTEFTPKLRMDMAFSSRKLFVEAFSLGFLTQNTKERVWQPKGTPGDGGRHEK
jgi:hypothetical protein